MNKDRFKTNASLVWHFLKGSKRYFILAVSFAMLVSFLDLVNPKIIGYTVDTIIGNSPSTMPTIFNNLVDNLGGISHLKTHIWILAIMIVVVALLSAICRFLFRLNNAICVLKILLFCRYIMWNRGVTGENGWMGSFHNQKRSFHYVLVVWADMESDKNNIGSAAL